MATDYTALKAAVSSRGFSRLSAADQGTAVNDAVHELDAMEPRWPYLLTSTTGTFPLVIADVVDVALVMNTTLNVPVGFVDYEDFASWAGDLARTGTDPLYWYFTPGSTTSVTGYPVTSRTVRVTYWKTSVDLSSGTDEPLCPDRWRHLLKDMAVRNAHMMKSLDPPATLVLTIERKLAAMRTDLHYRQVQGPSMVLPSGCDDF